MDRRLRRASATLALLLLIICSFSCTGHKPELQRTFWQLDVYRNSETGEQFERLSVFTVAEDLDGKEDLESWILRMPEEELVWERDVDTLRNVGGGENAWRGSNSFAMPFDEPLPRGEYLLRIEDRAGEHGETLFTIPEDLIGLTKGELDSELFPGLRFEEGRAIVSSAFDAHSITVADGSGEIVDVAETSETEFSADRLEEWRNAGGEGLILGGFHEGLGIELKSGPYRLIPRPEEASAPGNGETPEDNSASENTVE